MWSLCGRYAAVTRAERRDTKSGSRIFNTMNNAYAVMTLRSTSACVTTPTSRAASSSTGNVP